MKHLEIQDLWIQQLIRNKILTISKVSTRENPADILTKNVQRHWLDTVCKMCRLRFPGEADPESVGSSAFPYAMDEDGEEEEELAQWSEKFQIATKGWFQHDQILQSS